MEFQRKHRPSRIEELCGQPDVVRMVNQFTSRKKIPHAFLLVGPPGTGKTTTARIIAESVGCKGSDYKEINAAIDRGIDTIREIEARYRQKPLSGKSRVWVFDEAHQLSKKSGGDAQTSLLKILEEPPAHAYFILCTTNPHDLLPAIISRCSLINFQRIKDKDIESLVAAVAKKEKIQLEESVLRSIVKIADGAARDALKWLDQIAGISGEEARLDCLVKGDVEADTDTLGKLLANPKVRWNDLVPVLKAVTSESETLRRKILAYFGAIALNSKGIYLERAIFVIDCFRDTNFMFDGKAGLIASCFEACRGK